MLRPACWLEAANNADGPRLVRHSTPGDSGPAWISHFAGPAGACEAFEGAQLDFVCVNPSIARSNSLTGRCVRAPGRGPMPQCAHHRAHVERCRENEIAAEPPLSPDLHFIFGRTFPQLGSATLRTASCPKPQVEIDGKRPCSGSGQLGVVSRHSRRGHEAQKPTKRRLGGMTCRTLVIRFARLWFPSAWRSF